MLYTINLIKKGFKALRRTIIHKTSFFVSIFDKWNLKYSISNLISPQKTSSYINFIEGSVQYLKEYLSKSINLLGYEDEYMKVNFASELQRRIE